MSKALTVSLTEGKRMFLRTLTTSGSSPARVQTHARILLLTGRSQGKQLTDKDIAASLRVSTPTIGKTRSRFVLLDALQPENDRLAVASQMPSDAGFRKSLLKQVPGQRDQRRCFHLHSMPLFHKGLLRDFYGEYIARL